MKPEYGQVRRPDSGKPGSTTIMLLVRDGRVTPSSKPIWRVMVIQPGTGAYGREGNITDATMPHDGQGWVVIDD